MSCKKQLQGRVRLVFLVLLQVSLAVLGKVPGTTLVASQLAATY